VRSEMQANTAITQEFGKQAPKAVADFAASQINNLDAQIKDARASGDTTRLTELNAERARWDEGGVYRVAMHTGIGALSGGFEGAIGAGGIAAGAKTIDTLQRDMQASVASTLQAAGVDDKLATKIGEGAARFVVNVTGAAITAGTGSSAAGMALNVDANNRQLHPSEAQRLAAIKAGKTPQEQARLDAAACALVRCADGVPDSDPNKAHLSALQTAGATYTAEQNALRATGEFEYAALDPARDLITRNGNTLQRAGGAVNLLTGSAGTVAGLGLTGAFAVGCPATMVSCAGVPVGIGLTTLSYTQAQDGSQALFGNPAPTEGQRVLDSFNPATHQGDRDPLKSAGIGAVEVGLTAALGRLGVRGAVAAEDAMAARAVGGKAPTASGNASAAASETPAVPAARSTVDEDLPNVYANQRPPGPPAQPVSEQVSSLVKEHSGQNTTPLTPATAGRALEDAAPPGGSTRVTGAGVQGADVRVFDMNGRPVGNVEIKAVDGFRGFQRYLSESTQGGSSGLTQVTTGDTIAFQVPNGADASSFLARYWGVPGRTTDPAELARLGNTYVVIYDQQGNVLLPKQPVYNPPKKP
jgi:filamentous hemagglutinin